MPAAVSLKELAEALEISCEGIHVFVNLDTGALYSGTDEALSAAEANDEEEFVPGWMWEIVVKLREVLRSSDWQEVPGRTGRHDYELMERFCVEQCEGEFQDELLDAIQGRGAFGRFKDLAHRRGILEEWYAFQKAGIVENARLWLESEGIAYRE